MLVFGTIAIVAAPGDTLRLTREHWVASEAARIVAAALIAWATCALVAVLPWRRLSLTPRAWRWLSWLVALGAGIAASTLVVRSIQTWGVRLDAPLVLYPARLVFRGERVPYRDIIDFNQPGTYLLYGCIDAIARTDRALRIVDAAALLLTTFAARRAFAMPSWAGAITGAGLYAVTHLEDTGVDCLQREVFVLALSVSTGALLRTRRFALAGFVFALCFWMKFHSILLVLPFAWDVVRRDGRAGWIGLAKTAGVVIGMSLLVVIVLWHLGALDAWLEIVTRYLPLYGRMAGTLAFSQPDLLRYRRLYLFFDPAAHPAVFGLGLVPPLLTTARSRLGPGADPARVVVGFYLCSLAYVLVQGTFWHYHSIPAFFGIGVMVGALVQLPRGGIEGLGRLALAASVSYWCVGPRALDTMHWDTSGRNPAGVAIANALEVELPRGETVQPLDIVQGAVDGMWRADVPLATPFLYDLYLHHDVDTPLIRRWRARALSDIARTQPYFILEAMPGTRVRPYGEGTDPEFAELDALIAAHYDVHREQDGFRWWRRRD